MLESWDEQVAPRAWRAWRKGTYGFGRRETIAEGLRLGKIEVLPGAPEGFRVDKGGNVVLV